MGEADHTLTPSQVSVTRTTRTTLRLPYQTGGTYYLVRSGDLVTLGGQGTCSSIPTQGNAAMRETIPSGYRPAVTTCIGWGNVQQMDMRISTDGEIALLGSANGWVNVGAAWITHDPMPN